MSRDAEARRVLKRQCQRSIEEIEKNGSMHDCRAHSALARGLTTLLQCEVVHLDAEARWRWLTVRNSGLIGAAVSGAVAAAYHYLNGK